MLLRIETHRTILSLMTEDDLEQVASLNLDPEVRKFFPDGIQTKEQTAKRINEFISFYKKYRLPCFVILDKESGEFLGRCGFGSIATGEIEVGYLIVRKFWGKGYATEVLNALLNWGKDNINTNYIIAFAPLKHRASQRVMEKCNMKYYKKGIGHGVACRFYRIKND
ncbi:GNAT family acetyltransferase [Legionella busanensis]|uniref:GNAT family acetyltransferase n=1 Tax=Legionella busanensis TaxID=190655 RepID=A0A378JKZ8_9GAMM|nr:GNAT family N-acetyltransferase [Legionella busanensis]STX51864.1 GNAT family acetyltransferase [Legionella busanensis]